MTDLTPSPKDQSTDVEDAVVLEETVSSSRTEAKNTQKKPAKTGLLWLFTVINLLILLLICAGGYWYYTQIANEESSTLTDIIALKQDISEQSRNLQSSVSQLEQSSQSLESNIANMKQANEQNLANVQDELAQANNTASALGKQLAEMSGRRPSDWLLAEANYLVNMAGRKLYLEKDIRTAMTLLKEADARLNDLNDPSLFPVRALIAGDIQALKQVNPVSTNSIALALAGMLPQVSELPLDKLQLPENTNQADLTLSEDVSDWRQNLEKTWQSLVGDLFSIEYVDQPLEPYLAERQQWLIEQQLNYALTQAQTAALNEHVELYRSATQQAMGLLVEHYQMDNTQVSQFLVALQELQNIDFSRNYPASLASQASLKGIIEQRIQGLYNNSDMPMTNSENLDNQL
ncbi:MAG: uroporphyrin-3 C-methyltransferase [Alphaproteobacteria bacterium]|jgi:uroporphyrin-3 C-methyltransferase